MRRALSLATIVLAAAHALAGDLDPPGGPVTPTMDRLDVLLPSSPISSLPTTITQPGAYHITGNLIGSSGLDGITIDCATPGTVEIDFRGFTIESPADAESTVRVAPTNVGDITLKRGYLRAGKRMTKAEIINEAAASRMKLRRPVLHIQHMTLADATLEAIQILSDHTVIIEDTVITGAGSHAIESHATEMHLHNVRISSVGGDGVNAQSNATEHVLLARGVSIIDADGDGVDAAFKPGVKMKDIVCSHVDGDAIILGDRASIENVAVSNIGGNGVTLGKDSDCYKDVSVTIVGGIAMILDDFVSTRDTYIADVGGLAISAGHGFHLSHSVVHGTIDAGSYVNFSHVTNVVDIDASGFTPSTFADGDHIVRDCDFIAHGTSLTNLPAFEFLGDDVLIERCEFLMADPPVGGPAFRAPPHFTTLDGMGHHFQGNTTKGIHPGAEGLLLRGSGHVIQDNRFSGIGQNATGILIQTATGCLISGNTFTGLGPSGLPIDDQSTGGPADIIGPIVTPATLSSSCSPDRNLHIPN